MLSHPGLSVVVDEQRVPSALVMALEVTLELLFENGLKAEVALTTGARQEATVELEFNAWR